MLNRLFTDDEYTELLENLNVRRKESLKRKANGKNEADERCYDREERAYSAMTDLVMANSKGLPNPLELDDVILAIGHSDYVERRLHFKYCGSDNPAQKDEIMRYMSYFERIGILLKDAIEEGLK